MIKETVVGSLCIDCNEFVPCKLNEIRMGHCYKRCEKCKLIYHRKSNYEWTKNNYVYHSWNENQQKYGEVVVLTSCLNCGELIPTTGKTGRYKLLCDLCNYKIYRKRRNNLEVKTKCRFCGTELILGVDYRHKPIFCKKCILIHRKIYSKNYYDTYREEMKAYGIKYFYDNKRPKRVCLDCKIDITKLSGHSIRCKPCQKESIKIKQRKWTKEYYKKNKWVVLSKVRNRAGTNLTKKNFGMAKNKDGTPNWDEELKQVKKLKYKINNQWKRNNKTDGEVHDVVVDNFHR